MSHARLSAALAAATLALGLASAVPAHAEFFGCNDHSTRVYSGGWHTSSRYTHYSHTYTSQPRRVAHARVTYSGATRYYDSRYR